MTDELLEMRVRDRVMALFHDKDAVREAAKTVTSGWKQTRIASLEAALLKEQDVQRTGKMRTMLNDLKSGHLGMSPVEKAGNIAYLFAAVALQEERAVQQALLEASSAAPTPSRQLDLPQPDLAEGQGDVHVEDVSEPRDLG